MKKFLVLYKTPVQNLDAWMATPEAERKAAEENMKVEWDAWAKANAASIIESAGAGKTTLVTKDGAQDSRNDIMLYSLVQAETQEDAAKLFVGHPHFGIPDATIEIMAANVIPGMG